MQSSSVSLLTAVVTAIIVFLLGVAWSSVKGARKGYQTVKNGVGPARKLYWASIGNVLKVGFWAVLLLVVLVMWQVHDVRTVDQSTPAPSPSVTRR